MSNTYLFSTALPNVAHRSDYYGIDNTLPMQTQRDVTNGNQHQMIYNGIHFFGGPLELAASRDRDTQRAGLASGLTWIHVLQDLVNQYNQDKGTNYNIVLLGQTYVIQAPVYEIFRDGRLLTPLANIYIVTGTSGAQDAADHVRFALSHGFNSSHTGICL